MARRTPSAPGGGSRASVVLGHGTTHCGRDRESDPAGRRRGDQATSTGPHEAAGHRFAGAYGGGLRGRLDARVAASLAGLRPGDGRGRHGRRRGRLVRHHGAVPPAAQPADSPQAIIPQRKPDRAKSGQLRPEQLSLARGARRQAARGPAQPPGGGMAERAGTRPHGRPPGRGRAPERLRGGTGRRRARAAGAERDRAAQAAADRAGHRRRPGAADGERPPPAGARPAGGRAGAAGQGKRWAHPGSHPRGEPVVGAGLRRRPAARQDRGRHRPHLSPA